MVEAPKHIAKEFMIGNTRVRIATDYCENKTPEQVQEILDRIARITLPYLVAAELKKRENAEGREHDS